MGQQQSSKQPTSISPTQMPQAGYRVTLLSPQYTASQLSDKLNLMTDYVIDKDPRMIDIKSLYENGHNIVDFKVFNVLQYRIRTVNVEIKKVDNLQSQNSQQSQNKQKQISQPSIQTQAIDVYTMLTKKPYTLGIKFKYFPKINDTILRVSKIFKNSPLQKIGIKKDEYIVGVVQGDFGSIKQFVELVKILIQAQVEHITLGICNQYGETRLQKINVQELVKWKLQYGVGYLGVQLAQGWLNKWQLKKNIDHRKKIITQGNQKSKDLQNTGKTQEKLNQQSITKELTKIQAKQQNQNSQNNQKEEVDFFKQSSKITHDDQQQVLPQNPNNEDISKIKSIDNKQTESFPVVQNQKPFPLEQTSKTSLQDVPMIPQQQTEKNAQINQTHSLPTLLKPSRASQPLPAIASSFVQQQTPSSISSVSSQQIQQKCAQLTQFKQQDTNVIKKTQNILEMNFKGILKNQNIDDASTICMCKDYSKHCEKCFKEKDQNYYFFNKKTNKIYTIEKAMMFPKKN